MGSKPLDLNDVEMVFGTPTSTRSPSVQPDVHLIETEKNHGTAVNNNKHVDSDSEATHPEQPLLEPNKNGSKPPLAGPEIDDLNDEHPADATPYPGIDDGLLEPNNNHKPGNNEDDTHTHPTGSTHSGDHPKEEGTEDGKWPWPSDETDHPYGDWNSTDFNGLEPRFGNGDRPLSPTIPGTSIPDVNTYQQKKNLAQGMMDLALLSANANQLRYVLESSANHPYFYPSVTFISMSIILQIAVGIGLILNSRYNVNDDKHICIADKINNMTVLGIFLITIVNVFITSFSVATPTTLAQQSLAVQTGG